MIHHANPLFTHALDYRTYYLMNRYQTYHDRIAQHTSRMQNRLQIQVRDHVLDASEHTSILSFLKTFKTA